MSAHIYRRCARTIVVDKAERVLLFEIRDPHNPGDGTWWSTPGGGCDGGETLEDAARRELFEETGLRVDDIGPAVLERHAVFSFAKKTFDQDEHYFLVRVPTLEIDSTHWTDLERECTVSWRWWSLAELESTAERIFPEELAEVVARYRLSR